MALRRFLDIALFAVFVALFGTAIVQDFAHEWLGMAAFALFVAHQVLNRRFYAKLFHGRYSPTRTVTTVVDLALAVCVLGLAASSLVLSTHVFGFLPVIPGAAWARTAHLVCSYWGFVLMAVHAGLHADVMLRPLARVVPAWVGYAAFAAIACFGVWSFVELNLASYLLLQVQFVFADPTVPLALTLAQYASVAVLIAGVACAASKGAHAVVRNAQEA